MSDTILNLISLFRLSHSSSIFPADSHERHLTPDTTLSVMYYIWLIKCIFEVWFKLLEVIYSLQALKHLFWWSKPILLYWPLRGRSYIFYTPGNIEPVSSWTPSEMKCFINRQLLKYSLYMVDVFISGLWELCNTSVSAAKSKSSVDVPSSLVWMDLSRSIYLFNISVQDFLIVYRHQISTALQH